jgi:TctA family transporter
MFSHNETGAVAGCFVIFVALVGADVEAGARRFGLTLPWWEATLILLAILVLIAILFAHRERAAAKRRNEESAKREQMKVQLEGRYPDARATPLSSGHWLLTDIRSGRTITEVTPPDRNLSP